MATIIQLRRGTAATWTSVNPTLAVGEAGVETDTLKWKVGDGSTAWTSLSYMNASGSSGVASFNTRTGTVTLTSGDLTALMTQLAAGSSHLVVSGTTLAPVVDLSATDKTTMANALLARQSVQTASFTAATGNLYPIDTTSNAVTVTLPTAPTNTSRVGCTITAPSPAVNAVTINCGSGDHFFTTTGATSLTLSILHQKKIFQYDTTSAVWMVLESDDLSQLDLRYAPQNNPTFTGIVHGNDLILPISFTGTLQVTTGTGGIVLPFAWTVQGFYLAVGIAPTGQSIIVDIMQNGSTIFTTQANRPTIAVGAITSAAEVTNQNTSSFAAGDKLSANIAQVGTSPPSTTLTVFVRFRRV